MAHHKDKRIELNPENAQALESLASQLASQFEGISTILSDRLTPLNDALRKLGAEIRRHDYTEVTEITSRLRAARNRFPVGSEERRSWEVIGELTLADSAGWWRRLRDPQKVRGRPRKPWPQRRDAELIPEMKKLVGMGFTKTTAARTLLEAKGIKISLKPRSDNLVRIYNKQQTSAL